LKHAQKNRVAIGHFNVADLVLLKAMFSSAQELNVPVLVGASAGERAFMGVKQIAALAKSSGRIRLPDFPQRRPYPLPPGLAVAALIKQAAESVKASAA
jgi:fructose/tagatose bisphosphate aldolase